MEITNYKGFINDCFNDIIQTNGLTFTLSNNYVVNIKNDKVDITLFTEHRKNDVISTTITDVENKKYFTITDIIEKKIGNNSYLSNEDKETCKSFNDKIKAGIYVDALVLKNYCSDILRGDFSSLGEGRFSY